MKCTKCNDDAITFIRYNGTHLCKKHFNEFVEKRVKNEMRKQGKIDKDSTIGVAVSGGKDSVVTLHLLDKIYKKRKDVVIKIITIDEGIKNYRNDSIKIVRNMAKKLGLELKIISFQDYYGYTLDEIIKRGKESKSCTYCGVFRRQLLNFGARELSVNYLATGLNLDDTSQSILMNFTRGDMERLARLGPHIKIQENLIPRIQPLKRVPEKEVYLYALVNELPIHDGECPYAHNALRNQYRSMISDLEERSPGTRHAILNSYESIKDLLIEKYPPINLKSCEKCGEPTHQYLCKACVLRKSLGIL